MFKKNKKQNILVKILLTILLINFLIWPLNPPVYGQSGGDDEVNELNQEISQKKQKIEQLQDQISEYQKNIDYQKKQSFSLSGQVSILTSEIGKLETEIQLKQNQIQQTNLEIKDTENKIATAEENMATQKIRLSNLLREINKQDQKSTLELVLTVDNFSDYYNHLHALEILQNNTNQTLVDIKNFKAELEHQIAELDKKKQSLKEKIAELDEDKAQLDSRMYAKQSLLTESRNSEMRFTSLVSQLKAEQSSINSDIVTLEKQIRSRLSGNDKLTSLGDTTFDWPVKNRGITAYFHDPDYPFRYLFEHPAVDLRASQGTPIKASASGYVAKVSINGTNYGYIMLVHSDGFSTVYGHSSKSYVKEDDYVAQGEVIGLSGGMPGTTGSGRLSTGPHLHFEVRKNGIPVNPLNYLP